MKKHLPFCSSQSGPVSGCSVCNICTCEDWKPQIKMIDSFIVFSTFQSAGPKWDDNKNIIFRYCPWCGGKLTEENHTTDDIKEITKESSTEIRNPFGLGPK